MCTYSKEVCVKIVCVCVFVLVLTHQFISLVTCSSFRAHQVSQRPFVVGPCIAAMALGYWRPLAGSVVVGLVPPRSCETLVLALNWVTVVAAFAVIKHTVAPLLSMFAFPVSLSPPLCPMVKWCRLPCRKMSKCCAVLNSPPGIPTRFQLQSWWIMVGLLFDSSPI